MKFVKANGESYTPDRFLSFNDVLLRPQRSRFNSRKDKDIKTCTKIGNTSLRIPIISANMDTITGSQMAIEIGNLGGLGILHRFYPERSKMSYDIQNLITYQKHIAFSVGYHNYHEIIDSVLSTIRLQSFDRSFKLWKSNLIICLDVAHSHMDKAIEVISDIKQKMNGILTEENRSKFDLIAGNISTGDAAFDLVEAGATILKVGIGSGSVCSTRIVTGHGSPQLSAIMEVKEALRHSPYSNVGIISDGGIKNSGDIVKAIAAGADAVMIGNLFAGCDETPGDSFSNENGTYKIYRGQASRGFMNEFNKEAAPEGETIVIKCKGPVANVIKDLEGGIRSGLTYSGAGDFTELREKAEFTEISHHGWIESTPHALNSI